MLKTSLGTMVTSCQLPIISVFLIWTLYVPFEDAIVIRKSAKVTSPVSGDTVKDLTEKYQNLLIDYKDLGRSYDVIMGANIKLSQNSAILGNRVNELQRGRENGPNNLVEGPKRPAKTDTSELAKNEKIGDIKVLENKISDLKEIKKSAIDEMNEQRKHDNLCYTNGFLKDALVSVDNLATIITTSTQRYHLQIIEAGGARP